MELKICYSLPVLPSMVMGKVYFEKPFSLCIIGPPITYVTLEENR